MLEKVGSLEDLSGRKYKGNFIITVTLDHPLLDMIVGADPINDI